MNKTLIVVACALVAMGSCAPDEKYMEINKKCIEETGVSEEMVNNTKNGVYSSDVVLAKYFACLGKLSGVMDDEGNIDKALLKKRMIMFYDDQVAIDAAVDKCSDKKATIEETALESSKCLYNELHK